MFGRHEQNRRGLRRRGGFRMNRLSGSGFGVGTEGYCICPECGEKILHERGIRCMSVKCPKCGHTMVRDNIVIQY